MSRSFFILLLLSPILTLSQSLGFLDVSTEIFGSKVRVNWIVAAGNECQDVEVQHSLDGETFETIYTYAGICGDPNFDLGYDYTHSNPDLNRANYYRIKINQDITSVFRNFVNGPSELNLLTDFNTGLTRIDFVDHGGPVILTIYNVNGKVLYISKFENANSSIYVPSKGNGPVVVQIEQNGIILRKLHL